MLRLLRATRPIDQPLLAYCLLSVLSVMALVTSGHARQGWGLASRLELPVVSVRPSHPPYTAFCKRNPGHCDMTGDAVVQLDREQEERISKVNKEVNASVRCLFSDQLLYDEEEYWTYPTAGLGDCEDVALEKRRRLVMLGLPRAAMTIAIVQVRKSLVSHAILLIETTTGTWALDSFADEVLPWSDVPYNYEARERSDGSWERYDQSIWVYD